MDKNQVIGFSLLGGLLVLFMYLNKPSEAELKAKEAKHKIELAKEQKEAEKQADQKKADKQKTVVAQKAGKKVVSAPVIKDEIISDTYEWYIICFAITNILDSQRIITYFYNFIFKIPVECNILYFAIFTAD